MSQQSYGDIMTDDLRRRACEHRTGRGSGFTTPINVRKLVYCEVAPSPESDLSPFW